MGLKDRIIPVPGLLHQKCRSSCRDRSERSNNPGAGTITPEVPRSRCRDRSHCHIYIRTPTRLHYPARLRARVIKRMFTKFVSIRSYSPEIRTFGTLITSTKGFSLIICKTL